MPDVVARFTLGKCPPSTAYAARNWNGDETAIQVYPYNNHEGGRGRHWERQLEWLIDHDHDLGAVS